MEALVLRVAPRHGRGATLSKHAANGLRIGRGLHNDVIVQDPYVGAEQFRLESLEGELRLTVLDRTNPVSVNGIERAESTLAIAPGDEIAVGQSVFSVLLESSTVAPTRALSTSLWARLGAWRPAVAVLTLLITALASLYVDWLDTVETPDWGALFAGPVLLALVITGWAALWAIVGRVLRHQPQFFSQLFASSGIALLAMQSTLGAAYLSYASGLTRLVGAMDWAASAAFSCALLYFNLRFATHLRRPALAAVASVALLLALLYGFDKAAEEEFLPYPTDETLLRAPFVKLREGLDFDAWEAELGGLFEELREN